MENQGNRWNNSSNNQKKKTHDNKNKPTNDPNAKNKYKDNQNSTNNTKGRSDNKPYQHPTRTNANVAHSAYQKPNQSSKTQTSEKTSSNPHNTSYQKQGVPGPSQHQNQRQNYSGQSYGNLKVTKQQNTNIGYNTITTVTNQGRYQKQNCSSQLYQTNQSYRNPLQQSVNSHLESCMVNRIALDFNILSIQLAHMRPNPFHWTFNQQLANMRPNPLNIAYNQARSSTVMNFNNELSSQEGAVSTKQSDIHKVRKWETLAPETAAMLEKPGFHFSVMSYNVLAQELIYQHPYLYRNHDQQMLNWNVRWKNLLQEIKNTDPDIMCLQEVQESHLQDYFSILSSLGYEGIYKKRTGVRVDGCAIYYKKDKVTALEHTTIEYRQPDVSLLDRDNVGLVVKFAPRLHPTEQFVVATTHLLYNPRREDVRLAQTQLLLTEIERISYNQNRRDTGDDRYLPVIITGDFNALPDSTLIKFITEGEIKYDELARPLLFQKPNAPVELVTAALGISDNCQHVDLLAHREKNITLPRSEEQKLIKLCNTEVEKEQCSSTQIRQPFSSGTLSHAFELKSVYDNQKGTTNQDGNWIVVDYIFFSCFRSKLYALSRYGLPRNKQIEHVTIPNKYVGSDHFSLIVNFKLNL